MILVDTNNRVPRLITFNDADFKEFTEIVTLNPFDVLGRSPISAT